MNEKEVVITYETLFELLRIEKQRLELQKLDPSFYTDVVEYLREKELILSGADAQTSLFDSSERDRAKIELDNIRRILRDMYNRREKKITEMAMNKAKTGTNLITTSSMLALEKDLYESLTGNLGYFRKSVLINVLNARLPSTNVLQSAEQSREPQQDVLESAEKTPAEPANNQLETPESIRSPPEAARSAEIESKSESGKKVRFLSPVGEIVGPDLQIYGPFDSGAITELPEALVKALINKGQAESFSEDTVLRTAV